ncbi:hypothetical protein GOP47_0008421 [Adiantum capillus-veneris]|uniref:Uncharacterized protein n=1 Tax=Adiantum capillus-veneris TaxID=13818 RepID=A0A9D4UYS5_ADICA|nr:hypothetical protein GOP47_0008421 [Adiantum capillus-veneris]
MLPKNLTEYTTTQHGDIDARVGCSVILIYRKESRGGRVRSRGFRSCIRGGRDETGERRADSHRGREIRGEIVAGLRRSWSVGIHWNREDDPRVLPKLHVRVLSGAQSAVGIGSNAFLKAVLQRSSALLMVVKAVLSSWRYCSAAVLSSMVFKAAQQKLRQVRQVLQHSRAFDEGLMQHSIGGFDTFRYEFNLAMHRAPSREKDLANRLRLRRLVISSLLEIDNLKESP